MQELLKPGVKEQELFDSIEDKLVIRSLYDNSQNGTSSETKVLLSRVLCFFHQIEDNDSWHFQALARMTKDCYEPFFDSANEEVSLPFLDENNGVSIDYATDGDLDQFVEGLVHYCEGQNSRFNSNGIELFINWLDEVFKMDDLLPAEKERLRSSFAKIQD